MPSSGGGLPFPTGGRGGRFSILGVVLMVAFLCLYLVLGGKLGDLFSASPESSEQDQQVDEFFTEEPVVQVQQEDTSPTEKPRPTRTPAAKPVQPAAATGKGGTWTVMLYQDADDKILEQDIYVDLNEVERTGSTDQVKIVAQFDRFRGAFQGDGDWTAARRYFIRQDENLNQVNSELVAELGEVNMSSGETLVDFVTWAIETYPADRYALILSDHGMGWPGGWSDPAPGGSGGTVDRNIPLESRLGDQIFLHELDDALSEIRSRTSLDQFELIGLDACLMAHLEVFSALQPHSRYAVASQEVEPALGWAYTGFLDELIRRPEMDGAELGRLIVESYIQDDQRIVDDKARAEMMRQGSMGGLFGILGSTSSKQLADQMEQSATLSAVDLQTLPDLMQAVNQLAYELQGENQAVVAKARSYAQVFTSIFGEKVPPSYLDLGSFASLLKRESKRQQVDAAVDTVLAEMENVILAEKHGPKKPGATGLSVYFPNSQLYQNPVTGTESYTAIADRFASESLWDDFLTFHYTNQSFEPEPAPPAKLDSSLPSRAPGSGSIRVDNLTTSSKVTAPGKPILLSADISGNNIGHIYLMVAYFDENENSLYLLDQDYLESEPTRDVNGVFYPTWSEKEEFILEFEWDPIVFNISDGQTTTTALFRPVSYGETFEEAMYAVEGMYTFINGSGTVNALLYFKNGLLQQVVGFTGNDETGAPREIIPTPGDTFTILETWLDLNPDGSVKEQVSQEGATLTFGDQPFTWEVYAPAPGKYVIGFVVEDMDGNQVPAYTAIEVR